MLRLSVLQRTPRRIVLAADGWISGRDAQLLSQEGARWIGHRLGVTIDLAGVCQIDADGIALLRNWVDRGALLRDGPPYVRLLLETHGLPVCRRADTGDAGPC
jgi:ABC-type transporter Mla MlaB component